MPTPSETRSLFNDSITTTEGYSYYIKWKDYESSCLEVSYWIRIVFSLEASSFMGSRARPLLTLGIYPHLEYEDNYVNNTVHPNFDNNFFSRSEKRKFLRIPSRENILLEYLEDKTIGRISKDILGNQDLWISSDSLGIKKSSKQKWFGIKNKTPIRFVNATDRLSISVNSSTVQRKVNKKELKSMFWRSSSLVSLGITSEYLDCIFKEYCPMLVAVDHFVHEAITQ